MENESERDDSRSAEGVKSPGQPAPLPSVAAWDDTRGFS